MVEYLVEVERLVTLFFLAHILCFLVQKSVCYAAETLSIQVFIANGVSDVVNNRVLKVGYFLKFLREKLGWGHIQISQVQETTLVDIGKDSLDLLDSSFHFDHERVLFVCPLISCVMRLKNFISHLVKNVLVLQNLAELLPSQMTEICRCHEHFNAELSSFNVLFLLADGHDLVSRQTTKLLLRCKSDLAFLFLFF